MNATEFLVTSICPHKEVIIFEDQVPANPVGQVPKRVLREQFKGVKTS
jgi:acyl-CoA synthetase (AMP-forming)/AMP-acid ligase II